MLKAHSIPHRYQEYTREPLSIDELTVLFGKLGCSPKKLLRKRDKAYKTLGLTGQESDATLIAHMAEHPTLLQRPIGVLGDRAVVGRPPENLLTLVSPTTTNREG